MGRIGQASVLCPAAACRGLLQVPRWTTFHLEVQPHPRVAQSLQITISDAESHVRATFARSQARTRSLPGMEHFHLLVSVPALQASLLSFQPGSLA